MSRPLLDLLQTHTDTMACRSLDCLSHCWSISGSVSFFDIQVNPAPNVRTYIYCSTTTTSMAHMINCLISFISGHAASYDLWHQPRVCNCVDVLVFVGIVNHSTIVANRLHNWRVAAAAVIKDWGLSGCTLASLCAAPRLCVERVGVNVARSASLTNSNSRCQPTKFNFPNNNNNMLCRVQCINCLGLSASYTFGVVPRATTSTSSTVRRPPLSLLSGCRRALWARLEGVGLCSALRFELLICKQCIKWNVGCVVYELKGATIGVQPQGVQLG